MTFFDSDLRINGSIRFFKIIYSFELPKFIGIYDFEKYKF